MYKRRIYLDTSVISHLDEPRDPTKMADTLKFWELLENDVYDIVLSSVVFNELKKCKEPKRGRLADFIDRIRYELITVDDTTLAVAEKFIDLGILKKSSIDDCRHIAAALVARCDFIISWNFHHMVNPKTIDGAKAIALLSGYNAIMIFTPASFI